MRAWFLLAGVAVIAVSACQAQPQVTIVTRDGREIAFAVEVADTPARREMGLQYRRDLAQDRGMIFLFPEEEQLSFWMKNTSVSLDMIFISADRKIVGVVENATPFSLDSRSVSGRSQYVLEINGGLARRYGVAAGDRVRFQGFAAGAGK
jgi:uncharacterized protein